MQKKPLYRRILLKLSGEALMGSTANSVDPSTATGIATSIKAIADAGVQVGIVIGGGNFFRGVNGKELGVARVAADHMGMLATVMNGILLQQILSNIGCSSHVMSALGKSGTAEPYSWKNALDYLQNSEVVIFVGGTGNPYFTTDSAAALRASEIQADVLLKATKVDGIYDKDPAKEADAKRYEQLTYSQAIEEKLKVMDLTAFTLCMENSIPIKVFNIASITQAITNHNIGTIVKEKV